MPKNLLTTVVMLSMATAPVEQRSLTLPDGSSSICLAGIRVIKMRKLSEMKKRMEAIQDHRWLPDPHRRDRVIPDKRIYNRKKVHHDE